MAKTLRFEDLRVGARYVRLKGFMPGVSWKVVKIDRANRTVDYVTGGKIYKDVTVLDISFENWEEVWTTDDVLDALKGPYE